ncbi:dienelactone hydrolase family protein [Streptomyces sp. G5(2025)]|uniref:dienelactone hydrolase family protein n=1 Tax=Streptomyces sp. G5(2025) TaxID=3406628 RepID=UPI003C134C55
MVGGGLHREGLLFDSPVRGPFRGTLLAPHGVTRGPAVLVLGGRNARLDQLTGDEPPDHPDRNVAERLARAGFVTLSFDHGIGGGLDEKRRAGRDEGTLLAHAFALTGRSLLGALIGGALGALDVPAAHPLVDPDRLGLFGHSLGAAVALHTALLAPRQGLPLCAASHLGSYRALYERLLTGHEGAALPGILAYADLADLYSAFRGGEWRTSLDTAALPGTGGAAYGLALVPEIVARADRRWWDTARAALPPLTRRRQLLLRAAELFDRGTVTVGGLGPQDADGFRAALWSTAGLPPPLVDRWCAMLREGLLKRGGEPMPDDRLSLVALPGNTFTCLESVLGQAERSGAVWVRPSRREPLSAARLVAALLAVGWPAARIGPYPSEQRALRGLCPLPHRVRSAEATRFPQLRGQDAEFARPGRFGLLDSPDPYEPISTIQLAWTN